MHSEDLGKLDYLQAWDLQEQLRAKRSKNEICDRLLLLEHNPVYTIGKRNADNDFLSSLEEIAKDGISIIKTNRGGKITYHGPGQVIGYFIFSLDSVFMNVKEFVYSVEEVCKRTLKDFGIKTERSGEYPGIWIGQNKIAAVGLHFSKGISQHGFALNVKPDLNHYRHIVPCGIHDRGVTSMAQILGEKTPDIPQVKAALTKHCQEVFYSSAGS